jgi:hypothetical protein
MTKKREPFIIDSMNDTDSDCADPPKTKAWKCLRKGPVIQETIDEVFANSFAFQYDDTDFQCHPFAFGGVDWCRFTPDAEEIRWQARQREEKLDEGAIPYFQEEEAEKRYHESVKSVRVGPIESQQDMMFNMASCMMFDTTILRIIRVFELS